jgi:hypothetical protein
MGVQHDHISVAQARPVSSHPDVDKSTTTDMRRRTPTQRCQPQRRRVPTPGRG